MTKEGEEKPEEEALLSYQSPSLPLLSLDWTPMKVIVRNLPYATTADVIQRFFGACGSVVDVQFLDGSGSDRPLFEMLIDLWPLLAGFSPHHPSSFSAVCLF